MDKLEVTVGFLSLSAQGTTGIAAAFLIVVLFMGSRFRK